MIKLWAGNGGHQIHSTGTVNFLSLEKAHLPGEMFSVGLWNELFPEINYSITPDYFLLQLRGMFL